jgi:hypothetical protein
MHKSEVKASFYRVMEALEEFKEESGWEEKEICELVLGRVLRSKNPVSIHELEYFFFLAKSLGISLWSGGCWGWRRPGY